MGAVVEGEPTTFQTPLSGHFCPVFAVVPIGLIILNFYDIYRASWPALFRPLILILVSSLFILETQILCQSILSVQILQHSFSYVILSYRLGIEKWKNNQAIKS